MSSEGNEKAGVDRVKNTERVPLNEFMVSHYIYLEGRCSCLHIEISFKTSKLLVLSKYISQSSKEKLSCESMPDQQVISSRCLSGE